MKTLYPPCRHRGEPRHREVYHCRSPKLVGLKLVSPQVCGDCPFRDHHWPGEPEYPPPDVYPEMPTEALAAMLDGPPRPWPPGWEYWEVTCRAHREAAERFLECVGAYPTGRYAGRGVVIAGGGARYFPSLYVVVRALRAVGCTLPVQVWYLGRDDEMPPHHAKILARYGVECVDGDAVRGQYPCRILNGWELKVFAVLHCPFEEVLSLDADCYPVRDPSGLFEAEGYRQLGAIFWPDLRESPPLDWQAFGATPTGRMSVESGQFVVNKRACWRQLQLAWWYNDHSDWSYLHGYGDKHTLEVAWSWCGTPYHRFSEEAGWSEHCFPHVGPDGELLFVHRCKDKFRFAAHDYLNPQRFEANYYHDGLPLERECFGWLDELAHELDVADAVPELTGAPRVARILAFQYTCPGRRDVWEETLARWRQTDWGADPVVVWDESGAAPSAAGHVANAHRMLCLAAQELADYYLFMEDDLLFNRHLRENLENWPPVREGWLWMGSLYNPGLPPRDTVGVAELWRTNHHRVAVESYYGAQAVVLSRAALEAVLEEWEVPALFDGKLAVIAANHADGIVVHVPSLVQQVPVPSTWGGVAHRAPDFDPLYRNPGAEGGTAN